MGTTKPNLANTIYQLAFDPSQPNVVYAAMSGQHDIPHKPFDATASGTWGYGGVWKSTDQGVTWSDSSSGLPAGPNPPEPYPACSIISDTSSSPATLYVSMWGGGVYKSTNSGASWNATAAISIGQNHHTYLLKLHQDGTLFCLLGPRATSSSPYTYADAGGLFKSTNGGTTWQNIATSVDTLHGGIPLYSPMQFDVDPNHSSVIYIAASDGVYDPPPGSHFQAQGGIYKTSDGGTHWAKLTLPSDFPYYDGMSPLIDPQNTNRVFLSTEAQGLYESLNAGTSWARVTGVPYSSPQRITFDTANSTLYLGTDGGGVWKLVESTPTVTSTFTQTLTPSTTYTNTQTFTISQTPTPSATKTATLTFSQTVTSSQTLTSSTTATITNTLSASCTPTQTGTVTLTSTLTPTPSDILQIVEHCPYPNPVKYSKQIMLYMRMTDVPDNLTVRIYTLSIRMVRSIYLTDLNGSSNLQGVINNGIAQYAYTLPLDLKDGQGNALSNGVYYYWVEAKKGSVDYRVMGKFVILH